jgi:GDPmannose 4,6-dehydratase
VVAMWRMLQQDVADDYVVATGETSSLEAFTGEVFGRFNLDWRDHVVSDPGLLRPTDLVVSRADPGKAQRQLGWAAQYKMRDVVRMMVDAEMNPAEIA